PAGARRGGEPFHVSVTPRRRRPDPPRATPTPRPEHGCHRRSGRGVAWFPNRTTCGWTMGTTDLDTALDTLPPGALACRDYGHTWKPFDAWRVARGAVEQRLRCPSCNTVRRRLLSRTGDVLAVGYLYPDGYLIAGLGRLTGTDRNRIRLATLAGLTVRDTAPDDIGAQPGRPGPKPRRR